MSLKVKLSKRTQRAMERKARIMSSREFQEWWQHRQSFAPTPSDPYRAYMIDLGLYARLHRKEVWKHRTNRFDRPTIDFPSGRMPRGRKRPKMPSRKEARRFKRVPKAAERVKLTPFEKRLVGEVEAFTEKYHLPRVKVEFEVGREGLRGTAYRPSWGGLIEPAVLIPRGFVASAAKAKTRKGIYAQVHGGLLHELGHHAHEAYGFRIHPSLAAAITVPSPRASRIEGEKIAWRVAFKHKKPTPVSGWLKKWALGTYLGTSRKREYID